MNNVNFNFWLQGYFELMGPQDGTSPELHGFQVKLIQEHIALVKKTEALGEFAAWLQGYLDAAIGVPGTYTSLGAQHYLTISAKLSQVFAHVVQPVVVPSGPGQSATLLKYLESGKGIDSTMLYC
jgi:hypothetical protein